MHFVKFIFRFLFARNWYSGELELSRPRVTLFFAMIFIVLLGLAMATILQAPVSYEAA